MRCISDEQCRAWVHEHCPGASLTNPASGDATLAYGVPADSSKKTCVARAIVAEITFSQPGLLWITEWGVFPSGENLELFRGYRSSLGEGRALHEAPGHVFESQDRAGVEALLALSLYFYWDLALFEGDAGLAAKASHDEWIEVRVIDAARRRNLQERFDQIGMERWKPRSKPWPC